MIKGNKGKTFNERVEIKEPEKKAGSETIVVQEKEIDVEIDGGKKK